MKKQIIGLCLAIGLATAFSFGAQAYPEGNWEKSEDGKYWMYMFSPDEPVKDEWVEYQGKIYYLDPKGYMKTGWVTNEDEGKKFYMGPDGAMMFNCFSEDGKYVGPDGAGADAYDKYRKAVRSQLKKTTPKQTSTTGKKRQTTATSQLQQFFLLMDLNQDGYQDLIIMAGEQEARNLLEIDLWVPEDQKFQVAAEFDVPDSQGQSMLYQDAEEETVWLEMTESNGNMSLFHMEYDDFRFDNPYTFTMETDEDGIPRFYVNGYEDDREYWELSMAEARKARGNVPVTGYLAATEENMATQIDRILSEEEVELWR